MPIDDSFKGKGLTNEMLEFRGFKQITNSPDYMCKTVDGKHSIYRKNEKDGLFYQTSPNQSFVSNQRSQIKPNNI